MQFVNQELAALVADPDEPVRIARGDTFELTAINLNDRGRMPVSVHLEFKHPDGSVTREIMQRTTIKESTGPSREAAFSSIVIKTPFEFRAVGGDDQAMEWFPLEVVPPPIAESLQVTLTPPKYTRRPVVKLSPGAGHIEGLVGTVVQIQATANKPLGSSLLRVKDKDRFPLSLSPDGTHVSGSFTIQEAGVYSYWLDLRDRQNFGNSDAPRYEIRAIQDAAPDIYIDQPSTDIQVTPTAEVAVRLVSKDDLGLHLVRLRYSIQASEAAEISAQVEMPLAKLSRRPLRHTLDHTWPLESLNLSPGMKVQFHAEATDDYDLGTPHVGRSIARTLTVVSPEEKTQELNNRQAGLLNQLSQLNKQESAIEAQTGELKKQLEKAGALRPQDLDLLQRVERQQRQIATAIQNPQDGVLVKTTQILKELALNHVEVPDMKRRLDQIKSELERLNSANLPEIEQQLTQARKAVNGGGDQLSSPDSKAPANETPGPDLNEKPASESQNGVEKPVHQEPIDGKTKSPAQPETDEDQTPAAAPSSNQPIPADGETNVAETPLEKDSATRPRSGDRAKSGEDTKPIPKSEDGEVAERISEKPRKGASAAEQALHRAQHHEQVVADTLNDLLRELSQWRDEREAMISLQEIQRDQEKVRQETAQLVRETVSKSLLGLNEQVQADLAKQSDRQTHVKQQVDQLQQKLGEIVENLAEEDPDAAGRLQAALDQLRLNNTSIKMRDAAQQISENNIGMAGQKQQEIAAELEELEKILKNEGSSDLEALVKQIDQAEEDLAKLQEQQEELIKKSREVQEQTDPDLKEQQLEELKKNQEELQRKAEQLARKLERLKLDRPAKAAQRAAERMQKAREELRDDAANQAEQEATEAVEDLEQARRELAQERKQIEESLAREQLEKVSDEIKALTERQRALVDEILRLDEVHRESGNWTRSQLKSLLDLAGSQRGLQIETVALSEKLSAAKVFALAAKGASRSMEQAATKLDARETGMETQRLAQAALQRFLDLLAAMKPEPPQKPDEKPEGNADAEQQAGKGANGEQAKPPIDPVALIAELKMLRSMQVDLNTRMLPLAEKRDQGLPLQEEELAELKELGTEQGELAEIASKFLEMFEAK